MRSRCDRKTLLQRASLVLAGTVPAIVLLFTANVCAAAAGADKAVSPRVKEGDAIFHQRCVLCHNKQPGDTSPFGPPNLNGVFYGPTAITTQQAETTITNGKGQMPAFGSILKKSEISDVIAYLHTLKSE